MKIYLAILLAITTVSIIAHAQETQRPVKPVVWHDILKQPADWYRSSEARRVADQVLAYQKTNGGWEKNLDMAVRLDAAAKVALVQSKTSTETTIDNGATYTQLRFLAKIIGANTNNADNYRAAFDKGVDYLLAAQYENGGFPQYFPLRKGYYTHITFNDNAMIGVLNLFRDIATAPEFAFVDENRKSQATKALDKAMPLILKLQIVVKGQKTIWAAQYDENSLQAAAARKFEPVALTAGESVGIVRFLMAEEKPNQAIIEAIEAAIGWYRAHKIDGWRWEKQGGHQLLSPDTNAPPLWARFTEIETMKPIFSGRDAIIRYDVMEIEAERRDGYAWYVSEPNRLLEKDYPQWKVKIKAKT